MARQFTESRVAGADVLSRSSRYHPAGQSFRLHLPLQAVRCVRGHPVGLMRRYHHHHLHKARFLSPSRCLLRAGFLQKALGQSQGIFHGTIHVVVPVFRKATAAVYAWLSGHQAGIPRIQRLVTCIVNRVVRLIPGCQAALYSQLTTVCGCVPKAKCLCSITRV